MIYKDQLDRKIELDSTPVRVVSLVPSQTELLVDLGLSDVIVGVTKFCVHPNTIRKEKTIVGGTKNIHLHRIKELKPDIVLCNKEENTKEIVETLQEYYPVHVSDIATIEESLELISQYGEIFNRRDNAKNLIDKIKIEFKGFSEFTKDKPKKTVAYFIWRKPWMVAGKGTFIHHLLEINNFVNVFGDQERYPTILDEGLMKLSNLDLILLSSEPFPFSEEHQKEMDKVISGTKIVLVDGEYFSWYGSRLAKAFSYFRSLH
ncbi:ABC-type Fe3+-hydroxamate transport system, substrate-binding protein [Aquimarina amphilecti]|uniref:ABC-type Fe3+-hydroxamate transport system, substrate-binding protein n=1 Tax=Aquimarina amphilecti TaxID=1038014 RepID=A0A1H7T3A7_AQUAM|nr:helical backbone metal receptor [Aquimarina amphilecti]SEL78734.1 ABC-type Fe3+-hydroxamate transport system, substrate-binding protein [Aquimarina amphilecti]